MSPRQVWIAMEISGGSLAAIHSKCIQIAAKPLQSSNIRKQHSRPSQQLHRALCSVDAQHFGAALLDIPLSLSSTKVFWMQKTLCRASDISHLEQSEFEIKDSTSANTCSLPPGWNMTRADFASIKNADFCPSHPLYDHGRSRSAHICKECHAGGLCFLQFSHWPDPFAWICRAWTSGDGTQT